MKNKTNRTLRKILSIALCLALVMSYVPMVSITAGAAATDITVTIDTGASVTLRDADGDDYYDIGTSDELYAFAAAVNGNNTINGELTADIVLNEKLADKVTVAEDGTVSVDASVRKWTPLWGGASGGEYSGTFDGDNHTITGLYCAYNGYSETGLISTLAEGATVKNVKIHDFCLEVNCGGAVVGCNRGEVIGCSISGTGILGWITNYQYVGGVVGFNDGTVKDCTSSAALTFRGIGYFGGIVGQNMTSQATIIGCSNSGTITAAGYVEMNVGGITGGGMGTVKDCYNTGSISTTVEDGSVQVGGIAGWMEGTVSGCYNTGSISATVEDGSVRVGGIAGKAEGTVSGCYNIGSVDSGTYSGGIAANAYGGTFADCYYLDTCVKTGSPEYSSADGITEKSAAQFASGEVAYLLNGDQSTITFKQTLGTDAYPSFTGGTVYRVGVTCTENAVVYANSQDTLAHNYVNNTCTACGEVCDHSGSTHTAVTDKGDGTHGYACTVCGTAVTEAHTMDIATGKCSACGADMTAIATVTDGTNTYYAADAATLNQAVTAILETDSRTFTVELPADAEAGMITAIRRAICDTEGVADGSIHLTLKGVTSIPGTTNWDGVAFGPRNAQWDENNVEIVSHEEVTQLASVNLPDVTEIGAQAFLDCSNLTSITAPKVQSIGDWGLQGTAITSIDMPLLKEAGYSAFCRTALTEVSLPSLETAGVIVFGHCEQLRTVDLPKLQNLSQQLFTRCTSLVLVSAPAATSMGINVFKGCSELVSITLPGVTELTNEAFAECTKLENITLGSVITKVNVNLFAGEALSSGITLTLNCGQKNAETLPAAAGTNVEWAGFTWKEVKFAHSYVNSKCTACGEDCAHTGGTATCTTQAVCESCGVSYGEVDTTNHDETVAFSDNGFCPNGCYEPATLNANGYYEINNAGQLYWFARLVNIEGVTDANAILTENVDLEGRIWYPIGLYNDIAEAGGESVQNQYKGTFDGNFQTVSNFTAIGNGSQGLLGWCDYNSANVMNLGICNAVVSGWNAGAVAGYGANLSNCYAVDCTITGSSDSNTAAVTISSLGGNNAPSTIQNCYAYNCTLIVGTGEEYVMHPVGGVRTNGMGNVQNTYYGKITTQATLTSTQGAEEKSEAQFKSGEVAYLLQQGNSEHVWGQDNNQTGAKPIFDSTGLYKVVTVGETGNYSVANVGDTNGDGTVDVTDYQAVVNKALADDHEQIETASYDDIVKYDLDGDGYLDVIDAYLLHLFINGFTTVDVYAVGDYDLNGKAFEEADVKAIKHAIENPEKLATYKKYASDINGDGKLDENDLTALTAKYGEVTGTECADNVKVYYSWGNKYSTCTATAMCTLCGKKVATETVNTTSETLAELTCTQDGRVKYTATFQNELLGTKSIEIVKKATGHSFNDSGECICGAKLPVVDLASQIEGGTVIITGDCRIIGDGNEYNISLNIAEDATVIFDVGTGGVQLLDSITVADGKTLTLLVAGDAEHTVNGGISLGNGSNVIIEGDLDKPNNKLTVSATDGNAGIGANGGVTAGDITIRNARVDATGSGSSDGSGAAIGTSDASMGNILIDNSIVIAAGGYYNSDDFMEISHAAAIGMGYYGGTIGNITLKNSEITASNNGDGLASVIGAGSQNKEGDNNAGTLGDIIITNTDLNLSMVISNKNTYAAIIGPGMGYSYAWTNMGKIIFTDVTQTELDEMIANWLPSDFNEWGAYALGRGYDGSAYKKETFGGVWVSDGNGGTVQIGSEDGYYCINDAID